MKKIFSLMFAGLLTLSACHNNDEPNGPDNITGNIYLAVSNTFEEGDMVITAKGDIIYQCAPQTRITRFLADGSDWYAVAYQYLETGETGDIVIKNGNIIYTTTETIEDLCIDDGNIYTLQDPDHWWNGQWVCKNFTHTYFLPTEQFASLQMVVNHGDITLAPISSNDACYWHNGELIAMQGMDGELHNCFIDKDGDDVLIGINSDKYYRTGYWRNGNYSQLDIKNNIRQVKLVGGKSYILGSHYTSYAPNGQGINVVSSSDAVVIIDGEEQVLRTGNNINYAKSMTLHNNDIYILVRENDMTTVIKSFIYKNMKPIELDQDITEREIIDFAIIGS